MYIKKIYIDNFKTYRKFELTANKDVNVLGNTGDTILISSMRRRDNKYYVPRLLHVPRLLPA